MCQGKLSEEVKGEPMFYEEKLEDSIPDENSRKVKGDIQHWGVPHLASKVKTIG